jgi:FlaA1/EpsC-like NDP-sugar epimerase
MTKLFLLIQNSILNLPRVTKSLMAGFVDISLCISISWVAFAVRKNEIFYFDENVATTSLISAIIAIPLFYSFGLYNAIFRFIDSSVLIEIGKPFVYYTFIFSCVIAFIGIDGVPRTVGLIQPIFLFISIVLSRFLVQFSLGVHYQKPLNESELPKALIVGAGQTGRQFAQSTRHSSEINVIGFLDEDKTIQGQKLHGVQVYSFEELPYLIKKENISHVLLAVPSASRNKKNQIIRNLGKYNLNVRIVPTSSDIAKGRVIKSELLPLELEDLLFRDQVTPNFPLLAKYITGTTVLVSGAGGSIGSELCRQIFKLKCLKLILLDFNEFGLYSVHSELESAQAKLDESERIQIIPLIANVQSEASIHRIIEKFRPDIVYHAAAYKHVPLVEANLNEGLQNNVFAAINIARAVINSGVSKFVLISTDKAVRPTNIMGASKRLAEIALKSLFERKDIQIKSSLAIVRFGNVLDSSGSVLPKFLKQIKDGGPITLTHPDITRYFMTIPEASQLVIQASSMTLGGDVFVLDMGEPVKIKKLAERLIELSGLSVRSVLNPYGDIEITITGLRPGEKLFEETLIGENPLPTDHPKIYRECDLTVEWQTLEPQLNFLSSHLENNEDKKALEILDDLVEGYNPSLEIINWTS